MELQPVRTPISTVRTGGEYGAWPVLAESGGRLVLLSFSDGMGEVSRWDPQTGGDVWHLTLRSGSNECAVVCLDGAGAVLAVASEDGVERLDVLTGAVLPSPFMERVGTVWGVGVGLLADGRSFFAGAGHHHVVHRWDAVTGKVLGEPLTGHGSCVMSVAVVAGRGNSAAMIASGDESGVILRWDAATGAPVGARITGSRSMICQIESLSLRNGSALLACVDRDSVLWRWDAATGEPVGEPVPLGAECPRVAAAVVDGAARLFTSGTDDGMVREWDAVTGRLVGVPMAGMSFDVLVRADGSTVFANGSRDGEITLYT